LSQSRQESVILFAHFGGMVIARRKPLLLFLSAL
jgi:hypothetical protein